MDDFQGKTSRRTFLKAAGSGAIASAVCGSGAVALADGVEKPVSRISVHRAETSAGRFLDLVNPLQGTDSSPAFSRGNTLPLVAMPFGMAHWSMQTSSNNGPWFFRPGDQRIEGVRCTHQLSPWLSDYGYATFLPFVGEPSPEPWARASSYRPKELEIAPHFLKVHLLRYRCTFELVPTERCALLRIQFSDSGDAGLIVDLPGDSAEFHSERDSGVVTALTHANEGGVPKGFTAYYVLRFDMPFKSIETKKLEGRNVAIIRFSQEAANPILVRVGTSFISHEQALRNLKLELADRSFETVKNASGDTWEKQLRRIAVDGGTKDQQRVFYSGLYRALLYPRMWHEPDGAGNYRHYSPYNGSVVSGVMYADHGYWDVYRAWYPFLSIFDPARLGEILQSWVNASKEGGWLPQFPCPGYRACMTGSLIDSVFGDAAAKGIKGFDLEAAYAALKRHATTPGDPEKGYGRRGIEEYLRQAYISTDHVQQSAVETLDSAYGDFCIAQVARAAGHLEDAALFERRSQNWRNVFDPATGFMRGKKSNGEWLEPFNPYVWGSPYVEGAAWQHRFSVPHDVQGLVQAMGGQKVFIAALEEMLHQSPRFEVGVYGQEIHEMSEMAAVDFGQYAHSNQPVHHILYLFAAAGRPDLTQYWVRRVMNELYNPDHFAGDEDTGSMSAWFILSALGFYALCPGKPSYILGSPLFDYVTLDVENGRKTTIEALNNGAKNYFVKNLRVNGALHQDNSISHELITRGSSLRFEMTEEREAAR